jgi:hypothetical protein
MAGAHTCDRRLVAFVFQLLLLKCSAHYLAYNITIPDGYKVDKEDAYVCTVLKLPENGHKLIGVQPMADQAVVHHILLYGKHLQLVVLAQGSSVQCCVERASDSWRHPRCRTTYIDAPHVLSQAAPRPT